MQTSVVGAAGGAVLERSMGLAVIAPRRRGERF
jgi:hypothetical protein